MCSAVSTRTTGSTNGGALSGAVRTSAWRACRRSRASGQRCQIAGRVILKPTQLLIWGRSIQRLPGDLVASDHDDRVASSVANGILHLRRLTAAGRNNVMVVRVERGACCRRPIANSSAGTCRGMLFTPHVVAVRSDSNRQANGSAIAPRTSRGRLSAGITSRNAATLWTTRSGSRTPGITAATERWPHGNCSATTDNGTLWSDLLWHTADGRKSFGNLLWR